MGRVAPDVAGSRVDEGLAKDDHLFAIGDIHGCAQELRRILEMLPLHEDSTVVFLGDYIDRGNQSKEVVDTILELRRSHRVVALLGNHEEMLFEFLEDPVSPKAARFILNGGSATLASYADEEGNYAIPREHLDFFRSCPLTYETEDYFFVHAGVPEVPLEEVDPISHRATLLWARKVFLRSQYPWSKTVVHGHTQVPRVETMPNRINMDTGCVFGGRLSAMGFPSRQVYGVRRSAAPAPRYLREAGGRRRTVRFHGAVTVWLQRGEEELSFETRNYSPLGLCMRSTSESERVLLEPNELIGGAIGIERAAAVEFAGRVVWVRTVNDELLYGIDILSTRDRP